MKTNKEMRDEAWTALFKRRWFGRFVWLTIVLTAITSLVNSLLAAGCQFASVQTVADYWAQNFLARTTNALPPAMPTGAEIPGIFAMSIFVQLIALIFSGISMFAMARASLRAARGEDANWFTGLLDGFKQPFGMLALAFRYLFQIFLWMLLFVIPGIIAFYRYRFAWKVKSDHPDWSAGQCLNESARLTAGRKLALFKFDCSYWKIFVVYFFIFLVLQIAMIVCMFRGFSPLPALASVFVIVGFLVGFVLTLILPYYMMVGGAVFYREVLNDEARENGV